MRNNNNSHSSSNKKTSKHETKEVVLVLRYGKMHYLTRKANTRLFHTLTQIYVVALRWQIHHRLANFLVVQICLCVIHPNVYLWIYLNFLLTWHKRRFVNFHTFYTGHEQLFSDTECESFRKCILVERREKQTHRNLLSELVPFHFNVLHILYRLTSKIKSYDWNL